MASDVCDVETNIYRAILMKKTTFEKLIVIFIWEFQRNAASSIFVAAIPVHPQVGGVVVVVVFFLSQYFFFFFLLNNIDSQKY